MTTLFELTEMVHPRERAVAAAAARAYWWARTVCPPRRRATGLGRLVADVGAWLAPARSAPLACCTA